MQLCFFLCGCGGDNDLELTEMEKNGNISLIKSNERYLKVCGIVFHRLGIFFVYILAITHYYLVL